MSEELKAAQARIACLEGEIAKRDEELAACRVAVENCEVFRARIVELEGDLKCAHTMLAEVSKAGMALRAELAALKEQEPVSFQYQTRTGEWDDFVSARHYTDTLADGTWPIRPLYAAPVSEAKAQEPDCDRSACGDFSPGPCDNPDCSARRDRAVVAPAAKARGVALDGSQLAGLLEQVRLDDGEAKPHGSGATYWNNAVIACQVAIRDALADHVQQVSVPDASAMARILADRNADACNVNREDNWAIHGQDYIDDVTAMLAAAQAAPAADAGVNDHD